MESGRRDAYPQRGRFYHRAGGNKGSNGNINERRQTEG